jgi:predicted  nucleic acid-binding Zn-ribbon protein
MTNMSEDVFTVKLDALHKDVGEVKTALNKLSDAITKLALVEQQQGQTAAALERAFKAITKVEENMAEDISALDVRVTVVEKAQPKHNSAALWVDRALVGLAGAGMALLAKGIL